MQIAKNYIRSAAAFVTKKGRLETIVAIASVATVLALAEGCKSPGKPAAAGGQSSPGTLTAGGQGTVAANPANASNPGQARPAKQMLDAVAVSQLREKSIGIIFAALASNSPELRANGIEALSEVPARLGTALPAALADANPGVRAVAAKVAGRSKRSEGVQQLQILSNDPVSFVRAAAIFALVQNGQSIDQTPLAQMLFSPDASVKAEAAYLLGELGNRSALPMLREAATRPMGRVDPAVATKTQLQIAEAMVKLGDDGAVSSIRAALYPAQEKDFENAALAAQILGQLRDKASADQLVFITAFQETGKQKLPAEVRLAAAGSLAQLGNDRGSFIADEYVGNALAPLRAQSAYVYGETGRKENLTQLAALLGDAQPLVQIAAAAAVLKLTDR